MFKKHMTPLTRGGQTIRHAGKGSQMAASPDRGQISGLAKGPNSSINDYAKATPLAQPSPQAVPGIGNGNWSGNGM